MKHGCVPKSVVFELKLFQELLNNMTIRRISNFSAIVNRYVRLGLMKEQEMENQRLRQMERVITDAAEDKANEMYKEKREADITDLKKNLKKAEVIK